MRKTDGARNAERIRQVRRLRSLSSKYDVPVIPDNSSRAKVQKLYEELVAGGLEAADHQEATDAHVAYERTFQVGGGQGREADAGEDDVGEEQHTWKFTAVQLTYNGSNGGWISTDAGVCKRLFDRFVVFICKLGLELSALGVSVTLERSVHSPDARVHAHAYLHLKTAYHRRGAQALQPFTFEGIHSHVVPNKAKGNAYPGAVR